MVADKGTSFRCCARMGGNRGLGFDPSFDPTKSDDDREAGNVTVMPEYYSARARRPAGGSAVLPARSGTHSASRWRFCASSGGCWAIGRSTCCSLRCPTRCSRSSGSAIWDIIYEHCSYFTPTSLAGLFRRAGFEPIATAEVYDGQFLTIEARPRPVGGGSQEDHRDDGVATEELVQAFGDAYREKRKLWQDRIRDIARRGQRAVIWGAGSKGVTFLNVLGAGNETVPYAVDLNPQARPVHCRHRAGDRGTAVPAGLPPRRRSDHERNLQV